MTPCSWASSPRRFETIAVPSSSETSSVASQKHWFDRNSAVNTSVSPHDHCSVAFFLYICTEQPYVWRLLGRFTSQKPGFSPRTVYVGFTADKVALGCVILWVLLFPLESFHCISAPQSHLSVQGRDSESQRDGSATVTLREATGGHNKTARSGYCGSTQRRPAIG